MGNNSPKTSRRALLKGVGASAAGIGLLSAAGTASAMPHTINFTASDPTYYVIEFENYTAAGVSESESISVDGDLERIQIVDNEGTNPSTTFTFESNTFGHDFNHEIAIEGEDNTYYYIEGDGAVMDSRDPDQIDWDVCDGHLGWSSQMHCSDRLSDGWFESPEETIYVTADITQISLQGPATLDFTYDGSITT